MTGALFNTNLMEYSVSEQYRPCSDATLLSLPMSHKRTRDWDKQAGFSINLTNLLMINFHVQ